ncbi:MAG: gas vesicle protein, partial [bacterium]
MQPIRVQAATINDLLERLLDKGVVLSLDLVIGVAGIPLIGVNLRAAIASLETMLEYG